MFKSFKSGKLAMFPGAPECHRLQDADGNLTDKRVISQRGIVRCLTAKNDDGTCGRDKGDLRVYLAGLPSEYQHLAAAESFVEFKTQDGKTAIGWDAEWFVDLCVAYSSAADAGLLKPNQIHLAIRARQVLNALAKVGIIALVDEATGTDALRGKEELRRIWERILRNQPDQWQKTWHDPFVHAMARLYGLKWDGKRFPNWMCGPILKIYKILFGTDVVAELKRMSPKPSKGNNWHQYLQVDSKDYLQSQLPVMLAIARTCASSDRFWDKIRHIFDEEALQLTLFPESD